MKKNCQYLPNQSVRSLTKLGNSTNNKNKIKNNNEAISATDTKTEFNPKKFPSEIFTGLKIHTLYY